MKQCYEKLTKQDHLLIELVNAKQYFFWPCDEEREAANFCDNWNGRGKMQEEKAV